MTSASEVLVAIVNSIEDLTIARDRHWYRIPVSTVSNFLHKRWPPQGLAFYQPQLFGTEAYAVRYFARIEKIFQVSRWQLFPDEPKHFKTNRRYYKLELSPLSLLPQPIPCLRRRQINFIPTIWNKLMEAEEINDLYDDSPLEDLLWAQFKQLDICAECQLFVKLKENTYALDFVLYCDRGKLNVETDGDTWHADKARILLDNKRDNDLVVAGWHILRFNTVQLHQQMQQECIPTIIRKIDQLGGLKSPGQMMPRLINPDAPQWEQLSLF